MQPTPNSPATPSAAHPGVRSETLAAEDPSVSIDAATVARFEALVHSWRSETMFSSSLLDICTNRHYQRIIGLGPAVVPLIVEQIRAGTHHWGWALSALTQSDLVVECETIEEVGEAWLREDGNEFRTLMSFDSEFATYFPELREGATYDNIGPRDERYNSIAFAAGDERRWWEPSITGFGPDGTYWPRTAPCAYTIEAYVAAFASIGYSPCADGELEAGIEKVAIFASDDEPRHASRQLSDGRWVSKMGKSYPIVHEAVGVVGWGHGGEPAAYLSRTRRSSEIDVGDRA